jgi:hypothetical protein
MILSYALFRKALYREIYSQVFHTSNEQFASGLEVSHIDAAKPHDTIRALRYTHENVPLLIEI